ncbi:MAG: hypothetical protein JEZ14_23995 [Marinilabiliaceae bacterium]|nr:hypothetical protein [Marinilabiliaceae bacterium]
MDRTLHIVSLTIPWPPNYGGAIDIFYKIKALYQLGINIHLHCFQYDRESANELEQYCTSVSYYQRDKSFYHVFSRLPYIVKTRISKKLINKLNKDRNPILVEGLHCCGLIGRVDPRRLFVRTHNIEHEYYFGLKNASKSLSKQIFYAFEGLKLKLYEKQLSKVHQLLTISSNDLVHFSSRNEKSILVPAFHPFNSVSSITGKGTYILIHGNMGVEENIVSTIYLVREVLSKLRLPVVISGKAPDKQILKLAQEFAFIDLIPDPSLDKMNEIIQGAQLILLHTFQNTGIKLKLLYSLYNGRHCLANDIMVNNTGLECGCVMANSPIEWIEKIKELYNKSFTIEDKLKRINILKKDFSNETNSKNLENYIFKKIH